MTETMIRDDFAGAGGFSLGKILAGVTGRTIGVEKWAPAVATARAAGFDRLDKSVQDVRDLSWAILDGYTGGPPCQPFSVAGKGEGRKHLDALTLAAERVARGSLPEEVAPDTGDDNIALVLEPMLVIARHRPLWVVLEQVRGVLPVWERYAEILAERFGYSVATGVVSAEQYGVPQTRKRALLVARLDGKEARLPTPTHSLYYPRNPARLDPDVKPWVSMAEALGWGMTDRPSMTVTGGGSFTGGAEPFGNAARQGMLREIEAERWAWARPSTTIVGSFRPDIVAAPGWRKPGDGPRQNAPGSIRVTVEQAGVLQSFPADYPWQGTQGQRFQQVGNAVPPVLAAAVISEITS